MNTLEFEITDDDIKAVLTKFGAKLSPTRLEAALDAVDRDEASAFALGATSEISACDEGVGDDEDVLDHQTDAAYAEIGLQLFKAGFVNLDAIRAVGDSLLLARISIDNPQES